MFGHFTTLCVNGIKGYIPLVIINLAIYKYTHFLEKIWVEGLSALIFEFLYVGFLSCVFEQCLTFLIGNSRGYWSVLYFCDIIPTWCFFGYWNFLRRIQSEKRFWRKFFLTLPVPCISESCIEIKIKLNFYFYTSFWCLKRFCERLKGVHKTFRGTTKKCENKNLIYFFSSSGVRTGNLKFCEFYVSTYKMCLFT